MRQTRDASQQRIPGGVLCRMAPSTEPSNEPVGLWLKCVSWEVGERLNLVSDTRAEGFRRRGSDVLV